MCSQLYSCWLPHKLMSSLRRSRECHGHMTSRWGVTGDASASNKHERGQAGDMGDGLLEPVHRRMEGKGGGSCLEWVLPTNREQVMTEK